MSEIKTLDELLKEGNSIPELEERMRKLEEKHNREMEALRVEHAYRTLLFKVTGKLADNMVKAYSKYGLPTLTFYGGTTDYTSTAKERMDFAQSMYESLKEHLLNPVYTRGTYGIMCAEPMLDTLYEVHSEQSVAYICEGFVYRTSTNSGDGKIVMYVELEGIKVEVCIHVGMQPALRCTANQRYKKDPVTYHIPSVLKAFYIASFGEGAYNSNSRSYYFMVEDPELLFAAVK